MEAMDKIRDEMAKTKVGAVRTLGEWMTAWLEAHPEGGEKVLADGKTLEGAYKAMEAESQKKRGIRRWLEEHEEEGLVFWLDGKPRCKIRRADFGLEWPIKRGGAEG